MRLLLLKFSCLPVFILLVQITLLAQKSEVYNGEAINLIDSNNQKQGVWLKLDVNSNKVVERGSYINNKKNGLWISYFSSGQVKNEITFKDGVANGEARFYYNNGKLWEQGIWVIDHWVSKYQFYYPSGQLAYDWNYNNLGKRSGEQKYYHENGNVKYKGNWENGKTAGALKIYNEKGQLTAERLYEEGKFEQTVNHIVVNPGKNNANKSDVFSGSGYNTIYTMSGVVEKKGLFEKGVLIEGEQSVFDSTGKVTTILIFKGGKLIESKIQE